jgi:glycosyltransferase involved in cell wall biosynthesis
MSASVIVTTYQRPEALKKVLLALGCQTRPAQEIVVADDGSGPDTGAMITDLAARLTVPVHHVWHEDRGFRAAEIRNRAIQRSTGDYILLLDGDCIPSRQFIQDHLHLSESGHFVQGKRVLVNRGCVSNFGPKTPHSFKALVRLALTGGVSNAHHLLRLPFLPARSSTSMSGIKTCNMGFHREDIYAVNGFNQDFVGWGREDSELAVRFYKYGLKRKTHAFMAICFHLWHRENDRTRLTENDEILARAIAADTHRCTNGLTHSPS